jgi:anti-sigma regulatory factor (Ser/Thr protein kinase)
MKCLSSGHLEGEYSSCAELREKIISAADTIGLPDFNKMELEMAAGELCINIIEHTYKNYEVKPKLYYVISMTDSFINIVITDNSKTPFNLLEAKFITPEEFWDKNLNRGLGLFIIRNFVDNIEYSYSEVNGNIIKLSKKIPESTCDEKH